MDTNKVWGIILIVLGVIFSLWGLLSIYNAFSVASQMKSIGGMFGGAGSSMVESMTPSKLPGIIALAIGIGSSFFGSKLLKNVKA
jgi:hypothetical protein